MRDIVRGISSMATRQLLSRLVADFEQAHPGVSVQLESVGGVEAAKRLQAGESFDFAVLARDAMEQLSCAKVLDEATLTDLVVSGVAVCVQAGAPHPDLSTEASLRAAVLAAPTVGYSTGPSGTGLINMFKAWGIHEHIVDKLIQARPGVPVGSLVASGEVALGFQQLSELIHVAGIDIVGGLPEGTQINTVFTAAAVANTSQATFVSSLLRFFASAQASEAKRAEGMTPITAD